MSNVLNTFYVSRDFLSCFINQFYTWKISLDIEHFKEYTDWKGF